MAFDAGAIEATLTLNRNPFTAGLAAAKNQARNFARDKIEATVGIKVDQRQLIQAKAELKNFAKNVTATAKVLVDRLQFNALLKDLKQFDGRTYSSNLKLDTGKATADAIAFRTLLGTLNDQTVNLNANTRAFGGAAGDGFGNGGSHFAKMATLIIGTLPLIASGFTAAVGVVGALASAFFIAGLGAGAFALVAVPAFKDIKAAVAGGQEAIDKLPPGLRNAATALQGLQKEYTSLQKSTERITGLALAAWFNAGTAALKSLTPLVNVSAKAFENVGLRAQYFFEGKWWAGFTAFLTTNMMPVISRLGLAFFDLIMVLGNLTRAFWNLGGSQIFNMIIDGLSQFALWTDKIGQNKSFQEFMDAAVRSLPVVGKLLGELIVFIFKLATGLEPLGTLIVGILNRVFEALNSLPPSMLAALTFAVAAFFAALALGVGAPVALSIAVIAGLATIFSDLQTKTGTLSEEFNSFATVMKQVFLPIWQLIVDNYNTKIKPAWDDLVARVQNGIIPALQRFGAVVMDEVIPKLMPFVNTITGTVIPAVIRFLGALNNIITFLIDVFGPTVARELGAAVTVFDGAFQAIAGLLDIFTGVFTADWTTFTAGITSLTRGFWTIVAGIFGVSFDDLKSQVQAWDTWIDTTWTNLWNGILSFMRLVWDTMGTIFSASLDLLQGNVSSAADKIGGIWRKVANYFRDPINWVINTVIGPPGGLAGAWNAVMSWIGAPGLNVQKPPLIPAFNQGGPVRGKGTGTSDENLALVSNGEFIVKESIASRIIPFLMALNGGQAEALRAASSDRAVDDMMMRFAGGGIVGGQAVLNTMRGRPYIWGGGSAAGTDCSGIVAMVQRGMAGEANPYRRIGTTSSMPWGGWTGGLTSALTSGVNGRGVGASHMVGNLAGTNFEARQTGTPIMVGGGARGPQQFPFTYSLSSAGGQYVGGGEGGAVAPPVSWWSIVADKVISLIKGVFGGDIPGAGGLIGDAMNRIPVALVEKTVAALKTKLESLMTAAGSAINVTAQGQHDNPLSGMGTTDRGGMLPPGDSIVRNATGRMEPLTNLDVYERMQPKGLSVEDVLAIIESRGGSGGGDTYNVMLPEKATVRELAETLDFKRRVVSKGRYSR